MCGRAYSEWVTGRTIMNTDAASMRSELIDNIRRNSGTAMWMGVALLVLGLLSLGAPLVAGISIALTMGLALLAGGISQVFYAVRAGSFGRGLLILVMGLVTAGIGVYMVTHPGLALATLTLFLAAWFVAVGACEIMWSLQLRPISGWALTLVSGLVSLLLGIMIWRQFPMSGAWAVGVLAGIKLIFSGWWLIFLARGVNRIAAEAEHP